MEAAALLGSAQVEMAGERWGPAEELLGQALKAAEGGCWGPAEELLGQALKAAEGESRVGLSSSSTSLLGLGRAPGGRASTRGG